MKLHVYPTSQELSKSIGSYVAQLSAQTIPVRGRFTVALSGGSLPRLLAPRLITEPLADDIDWSAWHVFFADERCVPLTHPDSNYRLVLEEFFSYVDIPHDQIYALNPRLAPDQAAAAYQEILRRVFYPEPGRLPRFDLILLGMGEDGHTASLFPNHPLLHETERWVAPIVDSPKPPPERITLTLPIINNAANVAFITTGSSKAAVLPQVLTASTEPLPAGRVQPDDGELHWFIDETAAAQLKR